MTNELAMGGGGASYLVVGERGGASYLVVGGGGGDKQPTSVACVWVGGWWPGGPPHLKSTVQAEKTHLHVHMYHSMSMMYWCHRPQQSVSTPPRPGAGAVGQVLK